MRRKNGSKRGFDSNVVDAAFAAGYCTRYIEDYARTQELNSTLLAERVAAIFHGQWTGREHRLSALRPASAEGSSAVGEVEVAKRSRNAVQRLKKHKMSARGRAAIVRAQKARWKKSAKSKATSGYWAAMTASERSAEMKRRLAIGRVKSAA